MFSEPERRGQVIDQRYRVLERLGQGGMGTVYLAEHIGLGQRRAIKFLHPDVARHPSARKRFLQEAQVVASLRHEHVIEVIDLGESGGAAYYVMELLEGEDMRSLLRRETILPWPRVRAIILQICGALRAAHARRITHRDLKPENCFCVRREDGEDFIKLLDFGIAKVAQEPGSTQLTGTGEPLGTVGYMALEQFFGQADSRSDIYAIGVMMYEMLAGRLPYQGHTADIIIKLNNGTRPRALHEIVQGVSHELSALVERATSPRAEDRFPDVAALVTAIKALPELAPTRSSLEASPVSPLDIDVAAPTLMALQPDAMTEPRPLPEALPSQRFQAASPDVEIRPAVRREPLSTSRTMLSSITEVSANVSEEIVRPDIGPSAAPVDAKTLINLPSRRRWWGWLIGGALTVLLIPGSVWMMGAGETTGKVRVPAEAKASAEGKVLAEAKVPAEQPRETSSLLTPDDTAPLPDPPHEGSTTSGGPEDSATTTTEAPLPLEEVSEVKMISRRELEKLLTQRLKTANSGIEPATINVEAEPGKPYLSLEVISYGALRELDHKGVEKRLKGVKRNIKSTERFQIVLPENQ